MQKFYDPGTTIHSGAGLTRGIALTSITRATGFSHARANDTHEFTRTETRYYLSHATGFLRDFTRFLPVYQYQACRRPNDPDHAD